MRISKLTNDEIPAFNNLSKEYGTIFNTVEWTAIFDEGLQRYCFRTNGGEIIGGFILYKESQYGLTIYRNPPFTPAIGPFLKVDSCNPVSIMDTWKRMLSLTADFMERSSYAVISTSLNKNIVDMQPFIWNKFKVVPGYTYIMDLTPSIEDLWRRMSNERRKNIRKGIKDGLYSVKTDDFELVRSLVLKTYLRQDKRINKYYLDKVLFEFACECNSFAYVTYQDRKPISCTFCIYDKKTAYYLLGGYDFENKHHGAGTMSMWEAVKHAQELGLRYFDFEGSMNRKIERYFRGFGGKLTPYYRINKAKLPLEILLKFFRREIF